jgi:hypothetical protein
VIIAERSANPRFQMRSEGMARWIDDEFARSQPGAGAILFASFWSMFTGGVAVAIFIAALAQIASATWPTTTGTITRSEYLPRKHSEWNLAYHYAVAGNSYTGTVYAKDPMPIQGETEVLRHVAAYPAGKEVVVSYDPDDPATSVLRPGLRGATLWTALFLTPFVILGVGMWVGVYRQYRRLPRFDPNDSRQVAVTEDGLVLCRPRPARPTVVFFTSLFMTAFAVTWVYLVIGIGTGVSYWLYGGSVIDPPVGVAVAMWLAVLAVCVYVTRRVGNRVLVLTIDPAAETVQIAPGGKPPVSVPLTTIDAVTKTQQTVRRRRGSFPVYVVEIVRRDGEPAVTVAEYYDEPHANALAAWLKPLVAKGSPDRSNEEDASRPTR